MGYLREKTIRRRVPRKALARVLAMAEEMSTATEYAEGEEDEHGNPVLLGVRPDVLRDLEAVRRFLRGK